MNFINGSGCQRFGIKALSTSHDVAGVITSQGGHGREPIVQMSPDGEYEVLAADKLAEYCHPLK
jgi:predicted fused transcriptional regulator/phosphomethylpyrimidine kinase